MMRQNRWERFVWMTGIMGEWPSGHGQPTKIRLSESCRGKTITMATRFDYNRHGFEGYPGNVGLEFLTEQEQKMPRRKQRNHGSAFKAKSRRC